MSQPLAAKATPPRFTLYGRYLLLERLAVGGMAEVYLAKAFHEAGPSDLLAIKRILPSLAKDDGFIRMFLDEAKIAGRLAHPGIVRIQELGRSGKSHYLAMDYVWGKDLLAVIRRCRLLGARLSPSFVAFVGAQMCEALHAAHTARDRHGEPMRVIHRDVSPQNVLISFDGVVKLIDFGIAKAQARLTQTQSGLLKGKIGYMSPEQVATGQVDHRSDLFAVGTCLYELLTLRALFARENSFDAMESVRAARAAPIRELRSDIPEALEAVLAKALSREPDQRWASGLDMQRALKAFLQEHDPSFDRVRAVAWIRDAFRKEFHQERRRLDALDQVGRPQLAPTTEPRRNSITELEIPPDQTVPDPSWEDDTGPVPITKADFAKLEADDEDDAPTEVFFTRSDVSAPGVAEPRAPVSDSEDFSWDPAHLHSGMIAKLVPADPGLEERAKAAREPTMRQLVQRPDPSAPPRRRKGSWGARIALGLLLLGIGAGGTLAWFQLGATAQIEVRTSPSVGAVVLLDGESHGAAPVRLENVAPGHHVLTIVAPGYEDVTRELDVAGHSTAQLDVVLSPAAGP